MSKVNTFLTHIGRNGEVGGLYLHPLELLSIKGMNAPTYMHLMVFWFAVLGSSAEINPSAIIPLKKH